MSQDIVADGLNGILNAKKAKKTSVVLTKRSKLLTSVLDIGRLKGYIKDYTIDKNNLMVNIGRLNGCGAIKPRFVVSVDEIEKFVKRYLPAKNIGVIIVSTSQGLMTHTTAVEKNIGGSLIAYMY